MNVRIGIAAVTLAVATPAFLSAQRGPDILPIPIASPTALRSGTDIIPLTPKEKVDLAIRNTFGPKAIVNRAITAGLDQWSDHPEEWPQGMEGYGMRVGNRMGRLAVRQGVQLAADLAFKTDPRYDRCDCTGVWPRSQHALKRVLITRTDAGGQTISVSRLAGAYVTPIITDTWYPDRLNTWGHKFSSGSSFLALRAGTNMLREFWPDIARKLRIRRK